MALHELMSETVKDDLTAHLFLDRLLAPEVTLRDGPRIRKSLRLPGQPPGQTLSIFEWGFQPELHQRRIETLATCGYIHEYETVLLQGPLGIGTTEGASSPGAFGQSRVRSTERESVFRGSPRIASRAQFKCGFSRASPSRRSMRRRPRAPTRDRTTGGG